MCVLQINKVGRTQQFQKIFCWQLFTVDISLCFASVWLVKVCDWQKNMVCKSVKVVIKLGLQKLVVGKSWGLVIKCGWQNNAVSKTLDLAKMCS